MCYRLTCALPVLHDEVWTGYITDLPVDCLCYMLTCGLYIYIYITDLPVDCLYYMLTCGLYIYNRLTCGLPVLHADLWTLYITDLPLDCMCYMLPCGLYILQTYLWTACAAG